MCGIVATTNKSISLTGALGTLGKRGPDARAEMRCTAATLGQTRLAIIDLSEGGSQPKKDNERDIAITFNGEIYNYRELRKELGQKGYRFASKSDTEVILKAYIEWGEKCLSRLDGMFAFVIADNEKNTVFMARDRFGKKPLYYALDAEGELYASSEIKALKAMGISPEIDPVGIDAYLALMYVPPWRTVYKNVHTLPPAHYVTFTNKKLIAEKWWFIPHSPITISYEEAKEETRRLLKEAVKKRMLTADVEVGAFLSGGVDSTIVTAYAQEVMERPIKTFSLGYGDYINELPFAAHAAEKIGTDHHTLQAHTTLTEELERVLAYMDEPHGDSANLAQHILSQETAKSVKVAIAGDGGDELFLGYGWYTAYWNRPKLHTLKNALFSNPFKEYLRSVTVFTPRERDYFLNDSLAHERMDILADDTTGTGMEKINRYDLTTYLPGQLLTKVDQTSMMHSLEVRCPFLDHHLAEFVVNLPIEYKANHSTGKLLLKDLLAEIMPRTFVDRKKQGFGAPVRKWLAEPAMQNYIRTKLAPSSPLYMLLRQDRVLPFMEHTLARPSPKRAYQLWVFLCLAIWLD